MDSSEESDFVRRKFTITEQLDGALEEMATQHYQGNVSLCIRQAITDHRETLNGNSRLAIKRLAQSIGQVQDDVDRLTRAVESLSQQVQPHNQQEVAPSLSPSGAQSQVMTDARRILIELADADAPLHVEDIVERVEMKPVRVRQALGRLIDRGYVFEVSDETSRYRRASMNTDYRGQADDERKS